jgi:hypothetical protein
MSKKQDQWFNNIARLIEYQEGKFGLSFGRRRDKDGNIIKVKDKDGKLVEPPNPFPIVINEGDFLPAKSKKMQLKKLVENGVMSQETADNINRYEKFEIDLPPSGSDAPKSKKQNDDDEPRF